MQNISDESSIRVIQQEIVKADLLVKAHLQDIRECAGSAEALNALNVQISENMKIVKSGIEELERLAREQDRETDRARIMKEVEKNLKQYSSNQMALRKANLACQALIDRQNKDELFERTALVQRKRPRADKEGLAKQSSSITDSLVALNNRMAVQVKQSEESLQALVHSSAAVLDTREEFKKMGTQITHSKSLLQKYGRREVTDRVLILVAVLFFLSCILYIVRKRLF